MDMIAYKMLKIGAIDFRGKRIFINLNISKLIHQINYFDLVILCLLNYTTCIKIPTIIIVLVKPT